jgi:hypothetical protein
MLAGKAKPRGCEKRASEPTGENPDPWGVGEKPAQKHDRPMLAGKAKPRGYEKRASEPKGGN